MASKNQRQHFLLVAVVVAGAVLAFCTLCSSAKGSLYSTCLSISVRSTFSVFLSLFFRSHSLTLPLYRYLFSFASCAFVCAIANISTNDKYVLKCERKIGYRSDMPLHFFSFRSSFHVIVCVCERAFDTKPNRIERHFIIWHYNSFFLSYSLVALLRFVSSSLFLERWVRCMCARVCICFYFLEPCFFLPLPFAIALSVSVYSSLFEIHISFTLH